MDINKLQQIKQRYGVVGNCDQLNHALDVCLQVASTDLSVLIIGESGVGKEILPRIIHDNSPRQRGKYIAINCGSIPEGTIDSELFGHEKGSFTGAIGESEGYFGASDKGTLFLDEIGELPLSTQARLLRVLETGEYIRVGGTTVRKTDVRIVAATNVNMRKAVSEGRFREDLFYRLNTIPVMMPPLRDRGKDILSLFRLFTMQMTEKYRVPRVDLTDDAKQLLLKYKWPGNIRQLKNITEQICILTEDRTITGEILLRFIPNDEESMALSARSTTASGGGGHTYDSERQLLFNMLFELQGRITTLNNNLTELQKQVVALGGKPSEQNHVLALPPGRTDDANISRIPSITSAQPVFDNDIVEEITSSEEYEVATPVSPQHESHNLHDIELEQIRKALQRHGGNRKKAAEELGMSDRTLYRRLKNNKLE